MGLVYFMSDPHLDHQNVIKFRSSFSSLEEHNELIKRNYHRVVTKNDKVFFLGDVSFSKESLNDLKSWKGTKTLILGNHDTEKHTVNELSEVFDQIHSMINYKGFILSHAPIHPCQLRDKMNIHGHVHDATVADDRYFNVSMESIDYTPINFEMIRFAMRHRPNLVNTRLEKGVSNSNTQ